MSWMAAFALSHHLLNGLHNLTLFLLFVDCLNFTLKLLQLSLHGFRRGIRKDSGRIGRRSFRCRFIRFLAGVAFRKPVHYHYHHHIIISCHADQDMESIIIIMLMYPGTYVSKSDIWRFKLVTCCFSC